MPGVGSLAGAAIGVAFAGIAVGATANIVKGTRKQLRLPRQKKSNLRLRRTRII